MKLSIGNTSVINGKVYYGGGYTCDDQCCNIVYCYEPSKDNWTELPPLPVKWFGLGQVNGKLVAIGGEKDKTSNKVYTYSEQSQKWKYTIQPIPTARRAPGVLSLQSALVVAGGKTPPGNYTDIVEIFKPDTLRWYKTDPLPTDCRDVSVVNIGNTCYVLGGYKHPSRLNQALYASVDDLLYNAVPANQTKHSDRNEIQSAWKSLPNTPTYLPAAAVLAESLFALGGKETWNGEANKKEIYMYSPSTNSWIYISDLPAPRSHTAVAVLSPTEILVIGGWGDGDRVNTV